MTFKDLYNYAINANNQYSFDIEPYTETYPEFEQSARYLQDKIQSISIETCLDNIISLSLDYLLPTILHNNKHTWFDTYLNPESEINDLVIYNKNDEMLYDIEHLDSKFRFNKSNHYFGSIIYSMLYNKDKSVRKYLHSTTTELIRHDNKLDKLTGVICNNNGAYCRIDDGSFSGSQFAFDVLPHVDNIFVCSTMYNTAFRPIGVLDLDIITCNGKDISSDRNVNYIKNHVRNKSGNDNMNNEDIVDNGIVDNNIVDDFNVNINNNSYNINNDEDVQNDVVVAHDTQNAKYIPRDTYCDKSKPTTVHMYVSDIVKQKQDSKVYDNNVYFKYEDNIYSVLSEQDKYNWFYFQHKYPDEFSITQSPLIMPTYVDDIVDANDIVDKNEIQENDFDYFGDHGVSIITGIEKKLNKKTGHYVNRDDTFEIFSFYY